MPNMLMVVELFQFLKITQEDSKRLGKTEDEISQLTEATMAQYDKKSSTR